MRIHESSCRAAGQLVAGRLQLGQGQQNGKLLLTRSLKIAHAAMANLQLVSQVRRQSLLSSDWSL